MQIMNEQSMKSTGGYVMVLLLMSFLWLGVWAHTWSQLAVRIALVRADWQSALALHWLGNSAVTEGLFLWHGKVVTPGSPTRRVQRRDGHFISEYFAQDGLSSGWRSLSGMRKIRSPGGEDWTLQWWIRPAALGWEPDLQSPSFPLSQRQDWTEQALQWVDPYGGQKLRPLLAAAVVHIGLFHADATGDFRFRYHVEGLLWNPYHHPIQVQPALHTLAALGVEFSGLPSVVLENPLTGAELFAVDLAETLDFRWQAGAWRAWVHNRFHDAEGGIWLAPGAFQYFSEPLQEQGLVRLLPSGKGRITLGEDTVLRGQSLRAHFKQRNPESGTSVRLLERNADGHYGEPLFTAHLPPWPEQILELSGDYFWLGRSEEYRIGSALVSYGFSLNLEAKGLQYWRTEHDLRSRMVDRAHVYLQTISQPFQLSESAPAPIYHPPQWLQPADTIGALRQLFWPGMPPHVMGQPHGGLLNQKVDSWYPELESSPQVARWNVNTADPSMWWNLMTSTQGWDEEDVPAWLDDWAIKLCELMITSNTPFHSVQDFLASGFVQYALPEHAFPLTQGDLLEPLLGKLSTKDQNFVLEVVIYPEGVPQLPLWQRTVLLNSADPETTLKSILPAGRSRILP